MTRLSPFSPFSPFSPVLLLVFALPLLAHAQLTPHHPSIAEITLFAEHPDIVTPTGIAVAPDGRVFVQENHTHHRHDDYEGPPTDRIRIFEDTAGDGFADWHSVFHEGLTLSTDLLFDPKGNLYATTRWNVYRFPGASGEEKAGEDPELIVQCDTPGDYPHNGVSGLTIRPDAQSGAKLAFGIGENLGAEYTFIGSDGTRISGGGEGGSTYLCDLDGSNLERLSTGHWNPFGMAFDLNGNLFATENDPGSCPPNRLLHVVKGADFGYEYRYGRSGLHPLITWTGEIPGAIGMVCGTGEAACGIIPFGPRKMLLASWADHRIELYELSPKGASFSSSRQPFIDGPNDFRPVHFSYDDAGKTLYISDWVSASYPVHGQGRIWRVAFKEPVDLAPRPTDPTPALSVAEAIDALGSKDPYRRSSAIYTLTEQPDQLLELNLDAFPDPVARAHFAVALKKSRLPEAAESIPALLNDPDEHVRFVAVKWIADDILTAHRPLLEPLLNRPDLSTRSFLAVMAALQRLDQEKKVTDIPPPGKLLAIVDDPQKPARLRAISLRLIPSSHSNLNMERLAEFSRNPDHAIRLEAVRSLQQHHHPDREAVLAELAADDSLPPSIRAEAILGLASFAESQGPLLKILTTHESPVLADEATRALVGVTGATRPLNPKPPFTDTDAWLALVDAAPGPPDPSVGRRVYFNPKIGTCFRCHQMDGRGTRVGPDMSTIHKQEDINNRWLLEHILDPNAVLAPQFMPWQITMNDGATHLGLPLRKGGTKEAYLGADGIEFSLKKPDIAEHRELQISLMPPGLLSLMTPAEIRDLLAFLLEDR